MKNILYARKISCRAVKTRKAEVILNLGTENVFILKNKKQETVVPEIITMCVIVTSMFSYSLPLIG